MDVSVMITFSKYMNASESCTHEQQAKSNILQDAEHFTTNSHENISPNKNDIHIFK
jgi:hypothetical protein